MPIKLESIKFSSFGQTAQADYPYGNIQDDIKVVLRYSVERVVFISDDRHIWIMPPPYVLGSVDNDKILFDADGQLSFEEFQEGDFIYISTATFTGYATVIEKIDGNTIRIESSLASSERSMDGEFIACTNSPKCLRYKYNFLGADDSVNYNNHLDNEENLYQGTIAPSIGSYTVLSPQGSKSHQIGSIDLRLISKINDYKIIFEITHYTKIFPFLKEGYSQALQQGQIFDDWAGSLCYGYAYSLDLLREIDDDTDKLSFEGIANGNTGAYNEHFNTGSTGFTVQSVTYTLNGNEIDSLDYDGITTVKVVYKSNGKFIPTLKTQVSFIAIHDDFDNYLDKSQYYLENFCFGTAGTSGIINIGQPQQVFTYYSQSIIDANTLEVTFRVSLGSGVKDNISKSDPKKYALFITSEQTGLSVINQVRSMDLVDISEFVQTLPNLEMISTTSQFWLDPSDQEEGYIWEIPETFMTDDVLAVSRFSFPKASPVKIISVKNEIIATGSSTVVLDSATTSLTASPVDPGNIQIPNVSTIRPLNQSYKSNILIGRGTDTLTDYVFNIAFPFIVGYREDKAILNQSIPSEVYEYGTVGNGLSSNWFKYVDVGMSIKYRITYVFEYLGKQYSQVYLKPINVNDYDNPEWTTKSIKLYDSSNVELLDGLTPVLKGEMTIKATFDKASLPAIEDMQCYFFVAKPQEDGYRTSSTYENTFKKVIFGSLSIVLGEVVATATINADDFKSNLRIWARLFEKNEDPLPPCVLISEAGDYLIREVGGYIIPETCELTESLIWDSEGDFLADSDGNNFNTL